MRDETAGGWRKLYNEELHKLYSSPNVIRMIKSRRMTWARHVARMRVEEECVLDFGGIVRRKETTRKTYVGGRIILRWIIEKWDRGVWIGLILLKLGTSNGLFSAR
jgi:hypothetical protein